jgi:hypothetical protein
MLPPEARLDDLAARLQTLEDKQALASLLNRYIQAVDSFDWVGWGECWTADAVANLGSQHGLLEGRDAIVAASRQGRAIYEARGGMQHILINLEFELDGDTATGTGNLLYASSVDSAGAPPDRAIGGKYRWRFMREAPGWQIARADLVRTWNFRREPERS